MRKINEFSDQGGEVSYNHMNNVVAGDGFQKINSKWMATNKPKIKERKSNVNVDKIFGKKMKFSEFYENKNNSEKIINIIKYGDNIKNDKNFWDNFIDICSNSSAISELFEVPKEKVIKWTFKIKNIKENINNDGFLNKNNKII